MQIRLAMRQMKRSMSSQKRGFYRASQTEHFSSELWCCQSLNFQPPVTVSQCGSGRAGIREEQQCIAQGAPQLLGLGRFLPECVVWPPHHHQTISLCPPVRRCGSALGAAGCPLVQALIWRSSDGLGSCARGGRKDGGLEIDVVLYYLGNNC